MENPVIVSAVRTIAGSFGGSLSSLSAADLGAAVVKEVVKRAGITGEDVDQLVFGCGWQAGLGPNIARICAVRGGLPVTVPAYTVNIRCASSMQAVIEAYRQIVCGDADVVIAGGTESGSNVPYIVPQARWGARMWDFTVYDDLHLDGFMCKLAVCSWAIQRRIWWKNIRSAGKSRTNSPWKATRKLPKQLRRANSMQRFYRLKLNKRKRNGGYR